MGDLKIKSTDTGRVATFKNVLYVPSLKKTLVSISRINRQSDDTSITFKSDQCLLKAKNRCRVKLKTLRSDGGGEYVSDKLEEYFKNHGIHHEVSTPRRQWQNGTAERMNRTLVEMARTMLLHANTAKHWWAEAVNTAAFLRNRIPNSKTDDKTPHEMIRGTKPKIASLKVFGCLCWRRNTTTDKIASRANMCTFLGYSETKKAYKVYDMEEQKVVFTVDCIFTETKFPHQRTALIDDLNEPSHCSADQRTSPQDGVEMEVNVERINNPQGYDAISTSQRTREAPKHAVRLLSTTNSNPRRSR
ncbi:hypothetical protein Ae201684_005159 [Aphanomyces euteiches]|uniref:Integrase catalytic domain-containing protein n=1 Tax=Aphanomyces euteiches TaxID=100861 RepID=A0A6G0XGA9_9STRA|nr:hypothetical protein Ae201684_005159 [Aphanomyces euteiches]